MHLLCPTLRRLAWPLAASALSAAAMAAPLQLPSGPPIPSCEHAADAAPAGARTWTGLTSSSNQLRAQDRVYIAGFDARHWSGELSAHALQPGSLAMSETPLWQASTQLDSLDPVQRRIFTHDGTSGVAFEWEPLSQPQKDLLQGGDSPAVGQQRLAWLRGDRTQETQNGGALRQRASRLGAIVNASPWHLGRPTRMSVEYPGHADFRREQAGRAPMVYVGANDGMLHGFDADTGAERLAYVPRGIYAALRSHTRPGNGFRYLVDGPPFSGDADLRTSTTERPDWRTLLVSGLAGGARGYVVLDVTDPQAFSASAVLLDRSFAAGEAIGFDGQADVGHLYAEPVLDSGTARRSEQIVKLNNGRWAVVMGNGVNSANERPVLLIQYLDGDRSLLRLVAQAALHQSNGLSAPRLIDVDGNGTMDIAYAGDLRGQLWKFNLTAANHTEWGVSAWDGNGGTCQDGEGCTPFFVARNAAGQRQPITAAPLWLAHPLGGIQLLLGTGQLLQEADARDTRVQSIYGLWDNSPMVRHKDGRLNVTDANPIGATEARTVLIMQSITDAVTRTDPATGAAVETPFFNSSSHPVAYSRGDPGTRRGWYMDLPEAGERVLQAPRYFEGQKAIVASTAPPTGGSPGHCDPGQASGSDWLTVLNMISGRPSAAPVFASPDTTMQLRLATRLKLPSGTQRIGLPGQGRNLDLLSLRNGAGCTDKPCTEHVRLQGSPGTGLRMDWREVRR